MNKLLILDMDGTVRVNLAADLNNLTLTSGFIQSPEDQQLIPAAVAAMKEFSSKGYKIVGATNQGGVAAGKKSLESCIQEQAYTLELANYLINEIYLCPDYEGRQCFGVSGSYCKGDFLSNVNDYSWFGESSFRKPSAGMLLLAIHQELGFIENWESHMEIVFVGDRPEDQQAAHNARIPFIHALNWWI